MSLRRAIPLLTLAALSLGCNEVGARVYSVAITESDTIKCDILNHTYPDPDELDNLKDDTENAWADAHAMTPSLPHGAELRVVRTTDTIFVWFEEFSVVGLYDLREGTPDQVFSGYPEPHYIQANYEEVIHPADATNSNVLGVCRDLVVFSETIELTRSDSEAKGRLHIVENKAIGAGISECAATLTCSRNLVITGAADEGQ